MSSSHGFNTYLDGNLQSGNPPRSSHSTPDRAIVTYIGNGGSSASEYHSSVMIDEFLVFSEQLSQSDINLIMSQAWTHRRIQNKFCVKKENNSPSCRRRGGTLPVIRNRDEMKALVAVMRLQFRGYHSRKLITQCYSPAIFIGIDTKVRSASFSNLLPPLYPNKCVHHFMCNQETFSHLVVILYISEFVLFAYCPPRLPTDGTPKILWLTKDGEVSTMKEQQGSGCWVPTVYNWMW